jgi:parallel beta-helix repeat protein
MTTYRRKTLFFISATLGLAAGLFPLSPASAASVACGDVLTVDTVLTEDLACGPTSDALVIGADDVTLNLAGHTISGPGAYATPFAGVRVAQQSGVTIENGTITGFQTAVVLDESTESLITKLTVHHNDQGINLAGGGGHVVEKNNVYANGRDAIRLGLSSGNQVSKNTVTGNVFGIGVADFSSNNVVDKNNLSGNRDFAIALFSGASNNRVEKNDVVSTTGHGIQVNADASSSSLSENVVSTSGLDGIHIEAPSTTLAKNTAVRNTNLGIFAPGAVDGGGNKASGNGNPAQCVGVVCK